QWLRETAMAERARWPLWLPVGVGASFQMSFAAVVALVATYEIVGGRLRPLAGQAGPLQRLLLYLAGIALTSLVAGLATAPFALFHFDRLALYGLAANMVAVPIAALWVMPCAVAALVLMPFGLEALALVPMGWGLDAVVTVAEKVAGWPGAIQRVPSLPLGGLLLVVAGGLWLAIWRRRWRFAGAPVLLAGLAAAGFAVPPDLLITGDGRLAGFRDGATLYVWQHRLGARDWRRFDNPSSPAACDALGCVVSLKGKSIAFLHDPRAQTEDCRVVDIVLASVPLRRACKDSALAIDRFDLWRHGAHAVWLEVDGTVSVRSVNNARGDRPWVPRQGLWRENR
ncbi:MAG: ComEC/Rec2 family competence protein, partial [Alphaproteobacteria bacterium]